MENIANEINNRMASWNFSERNGKGNITQAERGVRRDSARFSLC